MRDLTLKRLLDCRWKKDRKVDIKLIEDFYVKHGFIHFDCIKKSLEEFGMLEFRFPKRGSPFNTIEEINFNPFLAFGNGTDKEYTDSIQEDYSEIEDIKNVELYPVGETSRGNMILIMDSEGKLFGYTDSCLVKYGDNTDEMLDCLIGEYSIPMIYD